MDVNAITMLINSVGFPIVCVLGLAFFIYKNDKAQRADRQKTQDMLLDFSQNIKENTVLIKTLIDLITNKNNKDGE